MSAASKRGFSAAVFSCLLVLLPSVSMAQRAHSPAAMDELLKAIGLAKPVVTLAPEFDLQDANGSSVSLKTYRGRTVLLNFWATWCAPCRDEMPSMEHLSRSLGEQGLSVVAINQRESPARISKFMKAHGLNFTTPIDRDGRVAASYRVYGIPVSYLIDANGQAIGMKSGPMDWSSPQVVDALRKLIGEPSRDAAPGGSMELEPRTPLPKVLRVKVDRILVRGQQDSNAEVIARLGRGEELDPHGKVSGAGESWYMVKLKNGAVGWVKGAEVEDADPRQ